jgi:multidrug resistance efflux pump
MADQAGTTITEAPEAAPRTPTPRQRSGNRARQWRARFIVLLMLLFAGLVAWTILQTQATRDATVDLGEVTLTAQPIPVMTSLPGLVTAVDVRAGERVAAGTRLGQIEVTTTNSEGEQVVSRRSLTAPRAGIVADDPMTQGSTLQPGVAFLELYDPNELTLVAAVPLGFLAEISPGMVADLEAENVPGHIEATVQRAVPRVGKDEDDDVPADRLELVLVPTDRAKVARFIPGLHFTGTLDTRTGTGDEPTTVYVD